MTVQLPGEEHDSPATIGSWPLSSPARPGMAAGVPFAESGGGEAGAADRVGETDGDGRTEGGRVLVACVPLLADGWPGPELAVSTAATPITTAAAAAKPISSPARRERSGAGLGNPAGGTTGGANRHVGAGPFGPSAGGVSATGACVSAAGTWVPAVGGTTPGAEAETAADSGAGPGMGAPSPDAGGSLPGAEVYARVSGCVYARVDTG